MRLFSRALLVWGLLLAAVPATAASLSDKDAFTADVARSFSAGMPEAKVAIKEPLNLTLSLPNSTQPVDVWLDRMWEYCLRNKADCDSNLRTFVNRSIQLARQDKVPLAKDRIMAVIRSSRYVAGLRERQAKEGRIPVAQQLAGDLWIVCVLDGGPAARVLAGQDSEQLGLSNAEMIDLAKRNLTTYLPPIERNIQASPDGSFGLVNGDEYYASSRLLLHEQWGGLAGKMQGALVVTVPDTGLIFFADSAKDKALKTFWGAAMKAAKESQRPISPAILAWSKDGWGEWKK